MTDIPSEAAILAWARLPRAARIALGAIEADLKAAGFPPLGWYDVLVELRRAGKPLRPVEIERQLLLAQHTVSRLLDRLEAAGHVERQPCEADGRGQVIALKPEGQALLRAMWPAYRASIAKHVGAKLGSSDAEELARLLGHLLFEPN
jgi:DNA-binding MarR family transcriptional regulator